MLENPLSHEGGKPCQRIIFLREARLDHRTRGGVVEGWGQRLSIGEEDVVGVLFSLLPTLINLHEGSSPFPPTLFPGKGGLEFSRPLLYNILRGLGFIFHCSLSVKLLQPALFSQPLIRPNLQ